MAQYSNRAIVPAQPQSYGGPPTPTASGPSPKPGKSVSPQPIGSTASPGQAIGSKPSTTSPGKRNGTTPQAKVESAFPVRKQGRIFTLSWVLITVLFIVLAYDVLTYWQQSVAIENAGWNAATYLTYTLEGGKPSASSNPSATRPGRQAGT